MDKNALVDFVRGRGLAVLATVSAEGHPQAAVVGVAITDEADVVLDTTRSSRKFVNLRAQPRVALTIGFDWDDEQTAQLEGIAVEVGRDDPAVETYYRQFPSGRERAASPNVVYVLVRLDWGRYSDYRPDTFGAQDIVLTPPPQA